ncbi:hypothetical protein OJAV_G00191000 [Oryzias javanicus]|uniref:Uncharacterized protein n=1 Tax=Oryzias javanicus TaxID=123683 RepID=A0A3S2LRP5_ORYJA|nr:hypothetical protein OJAV_G00191000 [Oryzias javanicus]
MLKLKAPEEVYSYGLQAGKVFNGVQGATGGWTCVLLISPLIKLSVSCVLWDRGSAVISEKAEAPPVSISGNV